MCVLLLLHLFLCLFIYVYNSSIVSDRIRIVVVSSARTKRGLSIANWYMFEIWVPYFPTWTDLDLCVVSFILLFRYVYPLSFVAFQIGVVGYSSYKSNCAMRNKKKTRQWNGVDRWERHQEKEDKRKQYKSIEDWLCCLQTKWRRIATFPTTECVYVSPLKRYFNNAKWKISNITIVYATTLDTQNVLVCYTRPNPIHFNGMKLGCFLLHFFFSLRCSFCVDRIRIRWPCGSCAYNEPMSWLKFSRTRNQ